MKKGFTLIELLAVIVILAVIALVAVPTILNIIENARKNAFKDSAYGLINATEIFYTTKYMDMQENMVITCDDTECLTNNNEKLPFKGDVPTGNITINTKQQVTVKITNGDYCVYKNLIDNEVTLTDGNCNGITINEDPATNTDITITSLKNMDLIINSSIIATTTSASALVTVENMDKYTYFLIVINNNGDCLGNTLVHIPTMKLSNQRYFSDYSNGSFDAVAWIKYASGNQVYLARYTSVATSVMLYGIY
ncbi:MAG: type II secretion system protein [Bacilli bacterium]|nr:type II secretion system protein [Bacilli bacterium]